MDVSELSQIKKFALSLSAPLTATGSDEKYSELGYWNDSSVAAQLKSWWDIETKEDLEETLSWLDEEGGHTAVFNEHYMKMCDMTFLQREEHVESFGEDDWESYIRAYTIHRYMGALGRHTIRAFDIARYVMLSQAAYTRGWYSEGDVWERLLGQARKIAQYRMFLSHFDYLFSYYVGRTYSLKHGRDSVIHSMNQARKLLVKNNSPFLTFAPWPDFEHFSLEDQQHV